MEESQILKLIETLSFAVMNCLKANILITIIQLDRVFFNAESVKVYLNGELKS